MGTINVDPLRDQLPEDWSEILKGLQEEGFWEHVTVELARPNLGGRLHDCFVEYLKTRDLQVYRQISVPLNEELERNHNENSHLFNPAKMKILWHNIRMKTFDDNGQIYRYCSKGAFLCKFQDGPYPYGFFDARRGSCGFNRCQVGNSYGSFYLGTWEEIYNFSLTDNYRKIMEEEGFTPKEKLE